MSRQARILEWVAISSLELYYQSVIHSVTSNYLQPHGL